ncbi:hypothetical protein TNIN_324101, partial [Trichonephila inaurata madagascariensis]
ESSQGGQVLITYGVDNSTRKDKSSPEDQSPSIKRSRITEERPVRSIRVQPERSSPYDQRGR